MILLVTQHNMTSCPGVVTRCWSFWRLPGHCQCSVTSTETHNSTVVVIHPSGSGPHVHFGFRHTNGSLPIVFRLLLIFQALALTVLSQRPFNAEYITTAPTHFHGCSSSKWCFTCTVHCFHVVCTKIPACNRALSVPALIRTLPQEKKGDNPFPHLFIQLLAISIYTIGAFVCVSVHICTYLCCWAVELRSKNFYGFSTKVTNFDVELANPLVVFE